MSMTTLSPTSARTNLSNLLRRALNGDDIGIVIDGKIVALRPVEVVSVDYANREYGVSQSDLVAFEKHTHEKITQARQEGKLRTFSGDIETLLADSSD
jgi:antitoxin (DNA-binding transcriptional repressor) of toxin-antitoxin stability system